VLTKHEIFRLAKPGIPEGKGGVMHARGRAWKMTQGTMLDAVCCVTHHPALCAVCAVCCVCNT
jgi:hypothetical protein